MALGTLEGIKKIGGFVVKEVTWHQPKENFIEVNHKCNAITFKIQDGLIKENGVNGCQLVTLMETALIMLEKLNDKFPCEENKLSIANLERAILWQHSRTRDREIRKVEGTSNA